MGSLFENKGLDSIRDLLADMDDFSEQLPARFNRVLFRRIRRQTGTQYDWATLIGVTQATVGNWERGFTGPQGAYRFQLKDASQKMAVRVISSFSSHSSPVSDQIDVKAAERGLRNSILRAALTDFDFNPISAQIIAVPFRGDYDPNIPEEIAEDRQNLLDSLVFNAETIVESLGVVDSNISQEKFKIYIAKYAEEAASESPNPRTLNRLGAVVARITNSDDFSGGANDWDVVALEGFNSDHLELMRLYFREALAKAQEVDASSVHDVVVQSDGTEFREVARLMTEASSEDGEPIIDPAVPTLLVDIADEIREYHDSSTFTADPSRKRVLDRRKSEAFKNGGIYVGRFVFFSALLSSLSIPGVGQVVGALSLIVGITEALAPGTIRGQYETLRIKFPALPPLPQKAQKVDDKI